VGFRRSIKATRTLPLTADVEKLTIIFENDLASTILPSALREGVRRSHRTFLRNFLEHVIEAGTLSPKKVVLTKCQPLLAKGSPSRLSLFW
jgi:hypothetical protein